MSRYWRWGWIYTVRWINRDHTAYVGLAWGDHGDRNLNEKRRWIQASLTIPGHAFRIGVCRPKAESAITP